MIKNVNEHFLNSINTNSQHTVLQKEKALPGKIVNAVDNGPAVSIIMPFNPKMSGKHALELKLKAAFDKIEGFLISSYPAKVAREMAELLHTTIKSVDYTTYKISLAIFVTPHTEKVFYLDIPVQESINIDDAFEIRDLIRSKKAQKEYLLLVVSENEASIFKAEDEKLTKLVSNNYRNIAGYKRNIPTSNSNFTDVSAMNEIEVRRFLKHVDDGLGHILNAYDQPLIVMASDKIKAYFNHYSRNINRIVDFIPVVQNTVTETHIKTAIERYLKDWSSLVEKWLMLQLKDAIHHERISLGIKEVCKAAAQRRGRLLVVEKDFFSPSYAEEGGSLHFDEAIPGKNYYIKDAVDVAIEKVLDEGGDVAFVENGLLRDYGHIALVQFY